MNRVIMMKSSLEILLVVVGIALAGYCAAQNKTCDWSASAFQPIPNFDAQRLYNKSWYVQEIFARRAEDVFEPTVSCLLHHISNLMELEGAFVVVEQYTDIEKGIASHNTSLAQLQAEDLAVWWISSSTSSEAKYTTILTHTDYESYAIMYWCPYPGAADHNYERVLAFTGEPHADEGLLAELRDKVKSLGFPLEHAVQIEHHDDCDYDVCESSTDSCCDPEVTIVPPLPEIDLYQLILKRWFVHEIYFRQSQDAFEPPPCLAQTLTPYWDPVWGFLETYENSTGFTSFEPYYVYPEEKLDQKAVWTMQNAYTINRYKTVYTHTDYDNYGVMHWCPYHENADPSFERILTFTSSPVPDEALLAKLRGMVKSIGFPTEHVAQVNHHSGCEYAYEYSDDGDDESVKQDVVDFES